MIQPTQSLLGVSQVVQYPQKVAPDFPSLRSYSINFCVFIIQLWLEKLDGAVMHCFTGRIFNVNLLSGRLVNA